MKNKHRGSKFEDFYKEHITSADFDKRFDGNENIMKHLELVVKDGDE